MAPALVVSRALAAAVILTAAAADAGPLRRLAGGETPCINLSSYNYLGFADDWESTCKRDVVASLDTYPVSMCASAIDAGTTPSVLRLFRPRH